MTSSIQIVKQFHNLNKLTARYGDKVMRRYIRKLSELESSTIINCINTVHLDKQFITTFLKEQGILSLNQSSSQMNSSSTFVDKSITTDKIQLKAQHSKLYDIFEYLSVSRPHLMNTVVSSLLTEYNSLIPMFNDFPSTSALEISNASFIHVGEKQDYSISSKKNSPTTTFQHQDKIHYLYTQFHQHQPTINSPNISLMIDLLQSSQLKLSPSILSILYNKCTSFTQVRNLINYTHLHYYAPSLYIQTLIKYFTNSNNRNDAFIWYKILGKSGFSATPFILIPLLKLFHQNFGLLKEVLDGMEKDKVLSGENVNLKVCTSVMVAYYKLGNIGKVMEWYKSCENLDGIVTNVIMCTIIQEGGPEAGYDFYKELVREKLQEIDDSNHSLNKQYSECSNSAVTYTFTEPSQTAATNTKDSSLKSNYEDGCVFNLNPSQNLLPVDVHVFNTLLNNLNKSNLFERSNKVIQDMKTLKIKPDIYTFSVVLRGLYKQEMHDSVVLYVEHILNQSKSIYKYKNQASYQQTKLMTHLQASQGLDRVNDYVIPYLSSLAHTHVITTTLLGDTLKKLFAKGMMYDMRIWTLLLSLYEDGEMVDIVWSDLKEYGVDEKSIEVYCAKTKLTIDQMVILKKSLITSYDF